MARHQVSTSKQFIVTAAGWLWIEQCIPHGWQWELRDDEDVVLARSDRRYDDRESCVRDAIMHGHVPPPSDE
jgi:hypothetical protein